MLSPAVVSELVHKCDVVYHLAAAVGVRLIVEQPVHTIVTNIQGTETVLDYCTRFGKRVLVASTSEVYGDHREERPLEETARRIYGPTTARRWAYADSKAMDEFLALAYHHERGLDCVIVRLFNTVGPRQTGQYGMVIPRFVEQRARGRAARDPRRRDADPLLLPRAGHDPRAQGPDGRAVGLRRDLQRRLDGPDLDPRARRARDRADRERVRVRRSSPTTRSTAGIEDMLHRIPAIEKIGAAIGWEPALDLDRILADVIEHARATASAADEPAAAAAR